MKKLISIKVDEDTLMEINSSCKNQGISRSEYIRNRITAQDELDTKKLQGVMSYICKMQKSKSEKQYIEKESRETWRWLK